METITHEVYVSLEIAKLLKKAGFDWEIKSYRKGLNGIFETTSIPNNFNDGTLTGWISAPTLEVAQRWLREVKGCYVFAKPIFSANRKLLYYLSDVVYDKDYTLFAEFSTYERAQESGIKKALEIILEKGE